MWNSHGDKLTKVPKGFTAVAVTENSPYAAIENLEKRIWGLQFHPEVVHTPRGKEIISNFVHGICGCGREWTMLNYVGQAVEEIQRAGGQGACDFGVERRGGFECGGGAVAQGDRRPADVHFREQRFAAREGSGGGAGGFRAAFPDQAAV